MALNAVILASVLVAASHQEPATPGLLCISTDAAILRAENARCRPAELKMAGESNTVPALYLWLNADRTGAAVGFIGDGAARDETSVRLRIESASRHWPSTTQLRVRASTGESWHWAVEPAEIGKLRSIALPRGSYELSVSAAEHEPFAVAVSPEAIVTLGSIRLSALPVITGRVLDGTSAEPLPGAVVALPSGATLALADYAGNFAAALPPGEQPESLTVSYASYGIRSVPLPKSRTDMTLPPILLRKAGHLHVTVDRDPERYPRIGIHLTRKEGRQQTKVRETSLQYDADTWIVNDLDEGDYVVTVMGNEPQQRLASSIRLVAGETAELPMTIESIALNGTVTRGSRGVPTPRLTLKASPTGWTTTISGDDRGAFEAELWQAGRFVASVAAPELRSPYGFVEELKPVGNKIQWNIAVPAGGVSGTVVDAKSRRPIADARLTLDSEISSRGTTSSLGGTTDEQGRFTFEGIAAGQHSVHVEAREFTAQRTSPFALVNDEDHKHLEIALTPAHRRAVIVTSRDNAPLPGAAVLVEGSPSTPSMTDGAGRATIDVDPGRRPLVLVVPATGSFALARIGDSSAEPTPIVVEPPAGSLTIRALDAESGLSVGQLRILVRYNGEFITPELVESAARFGGMKNATNSGGTLFLPALPAGTYELWPYASSGEAHHILRGAVRAAAVVGISSGEYTVRLKFARPSAGSPQ